jgi:hypothetical protein
VTSKLDGPVSQTRPSRFGSFMIEVGVEDHCTRDGSSAPLVSSRPHTSPEEEDPVDDGIEDDGRSSREGER